MHLDIVKARKANTIKYGLYKEKFGVPVFTIISNSKGEIFNQDIVAQIKRLL